MAGLFSFASALAAYTEEELKIAAWHNATAIGNGYDMRIDCDGRYIRWTEYGLRTNYGWQVDHIVPRAQGGPDTPSNVRARHHLGNARAGGILGNAMANMRR